MDANELLKQYALGEREFRPQNLNRLKLANTTFISADFSGINLIGPDLHYLDLGAANLNWCFLNVSNLDGVKLHDTKIPDGRIYNDYLNSANYFGL